MSTVDCDVQGHYDSCDSDFTGLHRGFRITGFDISANLLISYTRGLFFAYTHIRRTSSKQPDIFDSSYNYGNNELHVI